MLSFSTNFFRLVVAASWLALLPGLSAENNAANQNGTPLLQAQLPGNVPVTQATCEQLTRAVTLATAAHRTEATSILAAALTRGTRKDASSPETKLPCNWVVALLHASVVAAPGKASSLMELASSLYPDCADALQKAAELFDDKNVVDDKNGPAAASPAATNPSASHGNGDPNAPSDPGSPSDPNDLNLSDPEIRDINFVNGYGPGFPGAPGFVGSSPGGSLALPSPAAPSVTPVAND